MSSSVEKNKPKYILGFDLGTTNSVLAYAPLEAEHPEVELLPLPQLVSSGTVESRTMLPSFAYLANPHEAGGGALDLPWARQRDFAVGEYARRQGAEVPDRTVGAAKSWLAYSRVDRHQPILPWGAPESVAKISPVTASQRYLEHMVAAWQELHPEAPVAEQLVALTVPASFDASARELTREAALAAGLPHDLVLLEEPQAAVYAWLADRGDRWRRALKLGDTLLVCDVGGGTTDLSLVTVAEEAGELALRRMAVGNHLLVGGDNMDLALAHLVAARFAEKGTKLDPWQSVALWHSCRNAKESLLAAEGAAGDKYPISVLGRGSRLIGRTVTTEVDRQSVGQLLVDGFFPHCKVGDRPARRTASGFRELGLPYEADTAITRHVAAFLQAHGPAPGQPVRPTHVLFNGGVFKADVLRQRLLEVLGEWFAGDSHAGARPRRCSKAVTISIMPLPAAPPITVGPSITAVCGSAAERPGPITSVSKPPALPCPGAPRPLRALCVVPNGMEEGTETDVPSDEIGLIVGEPAQFRFFSSSTRKTDRPGELLSAWSPDELEETDSLETTLPSIEGAEEDYVPVRFRSRITELGVLELWCVGTKNSGRWKLEFSVREDAGGE